MRRSSLRRALHQITTFLEACDRRLWNERQLEIALMEMRNEWQLADHIDVDGFIKFLIAETQFEKTSLAFPSRTITRYWWGAPTPYEVAASLSGTGYFSHGSALHLHGLTDEEPDTIYFNTEQQSHGARNPAIKQEAIDRAFRQPVRVSQNRAEYNGRSICQLSGKNTGNLGVINRKHPVHGQIRLTNLPRTLIDIVVRPIYSGGPEGVMKAYGRAAGKGIVQDLIRTLTELQHAYPYHQAIGFYLERSGGYRDEEISSVKSLGIDFDFYLDYTMEETAYSESWRIHYPPACFEFHTQQSSLSNGG